MLRIMRINTFFNWKTYFNKCASCCCFCMAFPLSSTDGMSNNNTYLEVRESRRVFFLDFRFTVLIKPPYFFQALVFIECWIMPANITPVRLELWEHHPHHTWWICPLKYGPRARPDAASQCGLTICRRAREEDRELRGRVEEKHFIFLHQ